MTWFRLPDLNAACWGQGLGPRWDREQQGVPGGDLLWGLGKGWQEAALAVKWVPSSRSRENLMGGEVATGLVRRKQVG